MRGESDPRFEHIFLHESLHAISAQHIRRSIPQTIKKIIIPSKSDFEVEEGMTEYYTTCMEKNQNILLVNSLSKYRERAIAIDLLTQITDPKEMMQFYLKNDQKYIKTINKKIPRGYSKLKKILYEMEAIGMNSGFDKRNFQILSPVREMLTKTLLKPTDSLETFKKNVEILLTIYSQEINATSYLMYKNNQFLKKEKNEEERKILTESINRDKEKFNVIKDILKIEWNKLSISDETLFNEIVMTKIKEKYPYAYHAVAFSNVFPYTPKKVSTQHKESTHSYTFNNKKNNESNEYIEEENVSKGRGR